MPGRNWLWIAGVVLLPLLSPAQDPRAGETMIRTSSRLVEVSVIVRGKDGTVKDLRKDDFLLTDRGKPRDISVFSVESGYAGPGRGELLPHNTFSNRAKSDLSSVTVILLDGLNTRFENQAYARRQLMRFLMQADPQDRIALYTLGRSLRVLCDFDHPDELRHILGGYGGSVTTDFTAAAPAPSDTGSDILDQFINESNQTLAIRTNLDRASITIDAFVSIASHLAQLPGRKNVVWVTGSLPFSVAGAARALNRADIGLYPVDARGLVGLPDQLTASGGGLRTGRATISFSPEGLDTLQQLADLTGGRAFYNTNDLSSAIRTAVQDAVFTYSLGFYPDPDSLDGQFHELKVQVRRPGLDVRYRRGYFAVKDSPTSEKVNAVNLATALWSPLQSSMIGLEARIQRSDRPLPNSLDIQWSIDVSSLHLVRQGDLWKASINAFFLQQDAAGRELDKAQEAFDIRLTQETYEAYLRSGIAFHRLVEAKGRLVTLRILVIDRGDGRVGSLVIPAADVKKLSSAQPRF